MRTIRVPDIPALIDELGGLTAAAKFFSERPQTVWNWRNRGQIPSRLFLEHSEALKARGIEAPASLWSFDKPSSRPSTTEAA